MADMILTINATAAPIAIGKVELRSGPIAIGEIGMRLPGLAGKSAYQEWLDLGNAGTEADFIASLQSSGVPTATTETLGIVKAGSGLLIAADGTLSVDKSQIHEVPAGGEANQVIKKVSGNGLRLWLGRFS